MIRRPRAVLALLLCAGITYALSQTLIVPAMPQLVRELGASPLSTSWLLTAYLVSAAVATPLIGRTGDLLGRGRVLTWVMVVFCAGSVLCAVGDSLALLVIGRVLQGVAGAVFPLAYGIIRDTFPAASRMRAIGTLSVSLGVGSACGPPLAGVIVDHAGPAAIFWVGMVPALPALAAGRVIRETHRGARRRVDWLGGGLLAAALAAVVILMTQGGELGWTSAGTVGLAAAAVALMWAWVRVEGRQRAPLVDLVQLRMPTVALTNVAALCIGCGVFMVYVPLAPMAQAPASTGYGFGLSVGAAGALLIPHGLAQIAIGPWVGSICSRLGSRTTLIVGAAINTVTMVAITVEHSTPASLLIGGGVLGVGQALALTAMATLIVAAVPQEDVGIATGVNGVMRTIGMAMGSALSAAILAGGGAVFPSAHAYVVAFAVASCVTAGAVASAVAMPRRPSPTASAPPQVAPGVT